MTSLSTAHHEKHFEEHIATHLNENGWVYDPTASERYDRARALFPEDVIAWIKVSNPKAWAKLERLNNGDVEKRVLDRLVKAVGEAKHGVVDVLRKGFSMAGAGAIAMSAVRPEDDRNQAAWDAYEGNILRVVRQVRYSLDNENAIDLVFFINGLPVATVEVKTDFTQSVEDAIWQYKKDRKPKNAKGRVEPLLTVKRGAIVHFAMSDSEIFMTTRLNGGGTVFLPFNRGKHGGAGNAAVPGGYPVEYFWKDVLQRDHWLRIFQQFVFIETEHKENAQGKAETVETMIFPRYHQWDAVTKIINAVREEGPGSPYLAAHSAGSGKTKTITWLAHELIRLRNAAGEAYFDSVILVTDRRVLDQQLQNAITQLDHQHGVVKTISEKQGSKSEQLAEAMKAGTPIIVVTLQTFPYAQQVILEDTSLKDRRFAIVIDEAHSSTGGSAAADLRYILTGEKEADWEKLTEDEKLKVRQTSRRPPPNASYFAFTATPKHSTLTLFGRGERDPNAPFTQDNKPVAFHAYTMQQAIEEGFILDVLHNYTTYKTAYALSENLKEYDTKVDRKAARRTLAKWTALHPTNVSQKVRFIIEHFQQNVAHRLNHQAKAMIVTSSRAAAVKYKLHLDRYIEKNGITGISALIAFSGDVLGREVSDTDMTFADDRKFNETTMNPDLYGRDLASAFDTPTYNVMVVANKFQTGFDQKKLVAMYLDKKVSGVEAVQTLSRLNRTYPGKDTTFVVDFVNDADEIETAFRTFYRETRVSDIQDPNIVYSEKQTLDDAGILHGDELDTFKTAITQRGVTHEKLYALTQPAADRFNDRFRDLTHQLATLERQVNEATEAGNDTVVQQLETQRSHVAKERDGLSLFRDGLARFVRTYQYIAQIIDLDDPDLEAFSEFARLLRRKLDSIPLEQIDTSALQLLTYALSKKSELHGLDEASSGGEEDEEVLLRPKGEGGAREARDREKERLSELIRRMNEAFAPDLEDHTKIVFLINVTEDLRKDETVLAQVSNNTRDDALKGDLPQAILKVIAAAMQTHRKVALDLLQAEHDGRRDILTGLVYDLLVDPTLGPKMLEQQRGSAP